ALYRRPRRLGDLSQACSETLLALVVLAALPAVAESRGVDLVAVTGPQLREGFVPALAAEGGAQGGFEAAAEQDLVAVECRGAGAEEQRADDAGGDDRSDSGNHHRDRGAQRKADGCAGGGAHDAADRGAGAGALAFLGRHAARIGAGREQGDAVAGDPQRVEV